MGGKGDEIDRAGLIVVFAESKAMRPSQRGAARFCIPDIQINAAADVVTDNGALASALFLRDSVRMPEHARHPQCFSVIAGRADVVENAMQKQCVAKFRASLRAQASIRNDLRLHFLGSIINLAKDLTRRVAHNRVTAVREAAKPVLVISEMNHGRFQLLQEAQSRKQVIGHAFRAVGVIGIASRPGAKRGHVGKVAEVQDGRGFVSLAEFEHCPGGPWVC